MPLQNLKVDPYKYQFSRKREPFVYHSALFRAKFWAKVLDFSKKNLKFESILAQTWEILKNQPIHIPNLHSIRGSFIYQEADFATHVCGTSA